MLLSLQTGAQDAILSVTSLPETDATRPVLDFIKANLHGILSTSTSMFPGVTLAQMSRESAQVRLRHQQYAAAPAAASSLPSLPVPAPRDEKSLYACHACNVKGHWKGDGKCRPEDVHAHLARLSALVHRAGVEEPPAPGTSGTGTELVFISCQCFIS
jgi:hypothetical protein